MNRNFENIYHEHKEMVYNLCLNYLQNKEAAEETTQDVFVKIYKKIDSFQENAQLKTWIYRIAINASLDYIKGKKRWAKIISIFPDKESHRMIELPSFDHPGVILEQKEALFNIFNQINQLSDNQKSAILLSKVEGRSLKEIGEILEVSPKAVESLLHRAKIKLKEKLNID